MVYNCIVCCIPASKPVFCLFTIFHFYVAVDVSVFKALYPFTLELIGVYRINAANNTVVRTSCHDMSGILTYKGLERSAAVTVMEMSGNFSVF